MPNSFFQRAVAKAALFALPLLLSACSTDVRSVFLNPNEMGFTALYWPTPQRGADYPEMQDAQISGRASFGVAFQGGGNRAAPAALGQIRALHDLGWIDEVRYISAISGGSWASIPYTFLKNGATPGESAAAEATFLGRTHKVEEVARTVALLARDPEHPEALVPFAKGSLLRAISDSAVSGRMIDAWLRGRFDEAFASTIEEIYLTPFDLGRSTPSAPDSLFTWRDEDEVRLRQSGRDFSNIDVHTVERDRPYLIVGGALLTQRWNIDADKKFRMEMTPLYSGVPQALAFRNSKRRVGGGFIESYGYDYITKEVHRDGETTKLLLTNPQFGNRTDPYRLNFSLANVAAVSGAAPVETIVTATPTAFLLANVGFPEHYIPTDQANTPYSEAFARPGELFQKEWAHGDGGHEDNLGLAPLLARQVDNIIVFANAFAPLNAEKVHECWKLAEAYVAWPETKDLPNCTLEMVGANIASYFFNLERLAHNKSLTLPENDRRYGAHPARPLYDLIAVAKDLGDDRVSCKRYDYNPSAAMVGVAYSPTICFVYLGLEPHWIRGVMDAVSDDADRSAIMTALNVDAAGNPESRGLLRKSDGFPHIRTFLDRPPFLIKTARARLFALSNLTAWTLHSRQDVIRQSFRGNGLLLP